VAIVTNLELQKQFEKMFSHRVANGVEITCLKTLVSEDGQSVRIAFGTRDRVVQVWSLDHMRHISNVFSHSLGITMPVLIEIARNSSRDIRVFGHFNGNM
jgi:hypothetical protein